MISAMKLFSLLLVPAALLAQSPSPYAGEETRAIKALSASDIDNLLAGRGMGLARPAELNSHPGPRHVLDLADELALTAAQRDALEKVFAGMKAAAVPLGRTIIEHETRLDRFFTSRTATAESVRALTLEIGRLQGELRAVHLNAHVATAGILSAGQVTRYTQLRGYDRSADQTARRHD